jgi:predicted nucleotidyltransferase
MKLSFDEKGHLVPYEIITIDWAVFVETFVNSFVENSTRHRIFEKFERFIEEVKILLNDSFEIWINGSFVTKKENPKDIDVVILVPNSLISSKLENLFLNVKRSKGKEIHPFLLELFPSEHPKYILYFSDCKYWFSQFSSTKPNRRNEHFSKGFIKINIQ